MNKELIKKYKVEFDHSLYGGKLQVKFVNDPWEEAPEDIFSYSTVNFVLVIDDAYVEFRKALAEGKNVQYQDREGFWNKIKYTLEEYHLEELRIEPEEPKFKVSDWVKILTFRNHVPVTIKNIEGCRYVLSTGLYADDSILELWQPQLGEWCWYSKWDKIVCVEFYLCKYVLDMNEVEPEYKHKYEPFIGQLPSYLRK